MSLGIIADPLNQEVLWLVYLFLVSMEYNRLKKVSLGRDTINGMESIQAS